MLFNADNQTKQRIFNQYKQDAIDYHQRKEDEKRRRIQEEREYIETNQKLEREKELKLRYEKMEKLNQQMNEYQKMLSEHNGNPLLNNTRKREVVSKNYGYTPSQRPNNNMNNNNMGNNNMNNMNNISRNNMNNNFMNNNNMNNMMMNKMNNLNNKMMNNMINNNINIIKNKFDAVFNSYNEEFVITVIETQSKIILQCKPNEEFISLYDYLIELSLEDFYSMGKSFKQCDNLNEIFNLIRNLMFQTNLPKINNYYIPVNNSNNLNLQVAPPPNSNIMQPNDN